MLDLIDILTMGGPGQGTSGFRGALPAVRLVPVVRRDLVQGLTAGSVKG